MPTPKEPLVDDAVLAARARASLAAGARLHVELARECGPSVARAARALADALDSGGKVLAFGNGGAAAAAQHFAAEMLGRFLTERPALACISLTADTSALTAIGNDYGFSHIFARQVEGLGKVGDVAVAISTSGRTPNVLAAVQTARRAGMATIALTGSGESPLAGMVDIAIKVPSTHTGGIQEGHVAVQHALCDCVEAALFPDLAPVFPESGGDKKTISLEQLVIEREQWRRKGMVVVWTNGCFDLLHVGHLHSIQAARQLGDVLIVGVNDDASVRRLKGAGRPLVSAHERSTLIGSLEGVTRVVILEALTPEYALSRLRPDVHCKGADYAPPGGKPLPERAIVESYGGRIEFLPWVDTAPSTSALIERARATSPSV
jgi:rfaE bifunctional protein nucleotidyltransferase chain/domain